MRFHIVRYQNGQFTGVMAGCGRNKGTWDSDHSRSAAFCHAKALRMEQPKYEFRVEPQFG